ncbi:LacI family DNA-binding transcriptional regulator [Megamonas hypermegale]|uniref:LacI family transcriptional regulator n=1 Tax=Megamonas hypermegale TaxID=158847 RepID=A0A921L841_9FIRM|nr:LacI family DNA-binding transcriptional regulator [Megamonas hypermegale]MDM8144062.1 LacI family DNA-binding transcriptional regulator [Megamonas hypermegale]HJF85167.1 LacI family transcriptional regulator [Megamonas hypermegale]
MKSTTIIDVAKKAQVSVATVSRVVNGNYPVKDSTRRKVLEAIRDLKYIPNIQARELNTQRSSIIGIIVPSLFNTFFAEVVNGIESFTASSGYSLLLTYTKDNPISEKRCMNELLMRNVSGIINISPNTEKVASDFFDQIAERMPMVFINSYVKRPAISYVNNDEQIGTKIALEYLISLGHKNICFIRGDRSDSYEFKQNAYEEIMKKMHNFREDYILNIGAGNSIETVELTAEKVVETLQEKKEITAIFSCNDLMGIGAVNGCHRLGIKVPQDMSVMGFDNILLSNFIEPKLTTMDQNMMTLGWTAASLLMEKIANENKTSRQVVLQNTLVLRDTTAACRHVE